MVEREEQLLPAVELAFEYDRKAVIEEAIPGFEVGCAALGSGEEVFIGEVDEIELKQGWLDYEEKYGQPDGGNPSARPGRSGNPAENKGRRPGAVQGLVL